MEICNDLSKPERVNFLLRNLQLALINVLKFIVLGIFSLMQFKNNRLEFFLQISKGTIIVLNIMN